MGATSALMRHFDRHGDVQGRADRPRVLDSLITMLDAAMHAAASAKSSGRRP